MCTTAYYWELACPTACSRSNVNIKTIFITVLRSNGLSFLLNSERGLWYVRRQVRLIRKFRISPSLSNRIESSQVPTTTTTTTRHVLALV